MQHESLFSRRRQLASLLLAVLLLCPVLASGATYYIDYVGGSDSNPGTAKTAPWKRAPGMRGFAGAYTHVAGDIIVFKGGVTWPAAALPMGILNSGASGRVDTYTTDRTWFSGAGWSQPVFDGGGGGTQLITASDRGFFTINDLTLQNVGLSRQADSFKAVQIANCHHFTLSGNTLRSYSWIGFFIYGSNGTAQNDLVIQNNDISNVAMGLVVATAGANTIIDSVIVRGNHIHDFTNKIGGGVHGDGIHFWGQAGDASQYIRNGQIFDNTFSGSFIRSFGTTGAMTGLIYLENVHSPYLIYNNAMSYSDVPVTGEFEGMIDLRADSGNTAGAQIYNNSLYGTNPGMSAGITLFNVPNATIRNNILSGMRYCYYIDSGSTSGTTVDYNDVNCNDSQSPAGMWNSTFYNFTAWRALGNDTHGVNTNPRYASPPGSLLLQPGSPVIGAGINLSTVFRTDRDGRTRPSTGPWTMGAYEGTQQQTTPPAPPTNVRIVSGG